jgi:hypothetical protein
LAKPVAPQGKNSQFIAAETAHNDARPAIAQTVLVTFSIRPHRAYVLFPRNP